MGKKKVEGAQQGAAHWNWSLHEIMGVNSHNCSLPSLLTNINDTKENFELHWQENQFGLQAKQKQIKNLPHLSRLLFYVIYT